MCITPFILNMKENLERKKSHIKKRGQLRPLSKKYDMCFELTNIQDISSSSENSLPSMLKTSQVFAHPLRQLQVNP